MGGGTKLSLLVKKVGVSGGPTILKCMYRSVQQTRPSPPLQPWPQYKTQGEGAYTRDATISPAITPSLSVLVKHDLIFGGGGGGGGAKHE